MTLVFDVLVRVLAGLLIAALLGWLIGDHGSSVLYLVAAVLAAGFIALVLDAIGSPFDSRDEPRQPI